MSLAQIVRTPLWRIPVQGGDVLHALKRTDAGFQDFGEAYISMVEMGAFKAWKLHRRMTLNLVVPLGEVRLVFLSDDGKVHREEIIGISSYVRLTVSPGMWFCFQGCAAPFSLVLNVVDIPHDPEEALRRRPEDFDYAWEKTR